MHNHVWASAGRLVEADIEQQSGQRIGIEVLVVAPNCPVSVCALDVESEIPISTSI